MSSRSAIVSRGTIRPRRGVGIILDIVETLTRFPQTGRPGRVPNTRELVIAKTHFIAPYRVRDDRIEILAVFHGARRWPSKFD